MLAGGPHGEDLRRACNLGLGLGATPVAVANMHALTSRFGPSAKAFLVVPLVGAFFIDLINAMVIKFFLGLPIMQGTFGG